MPRITRRVFWNLTFKPCGQFMKSVCHLLTVLFKRCRGVVLCGNSVPVFCIPSLPPLKPAHHQITDGRLQPDRILRLRPQKKTLQSHVFGITGITHSLWGLSNARTTVSASMRRTLSLCQFFPTNEYFAPSSV